MSVSSRQFLFFFFAWENLQKKKKKAEKVGRPEPPQPPRVRRPWCTTKLTQVSSFSESHMSHGRARHQIRDWSESGRSRELLTPGTMTHAGRAASSPEIFRPFLTVCLTVFPFEFRPRTSTIGFYGKKSFISELMILECSFPLMIKPEWGPLLRRGGGGFNQEEFTKGGGVFKFSPLWLGKAAELVIFFFSNTSTFYCADCQPRLRKMCAAHWDRMRSCYSKPY